MPQNYQVLTFPLQKKKNLTKISIPFLYIHDNQIKMEINKKKPSMSRSRTFTSKPLWLFDDDFQNGKENEFLIVAGMARRQ